MDYTKPVSRLHCPAVPAANSPRKRTPATVDTLENLHPSRKAGTSQTPIPAPIPPAAHSRIPSTNPLALVASVHLGSFRKHNAPAESL
jgi:hypothetical protein